MIAESKIDNVRQVTPRNDPGATCEGAGPTLMKRILATAAAASIAATFVIALPTSDSQQSSPTTTLASNSIKPQISTTLGEEIRSEVLLTTDDIAKAKKRVEDGVPKTVPKDAQPPSSSQSGRVDKGAGQSGKGDAKAFRKFMNEARSYAAKAKEHPYKIEEKPKATTGLSMENANAWTHSYAVGDTPPGVLEQLCFSNTETQYTVMFDRYTYCTRQPFTIDYWEVDSVTGEKKDHLGTSSGRMEIFGQNYTDTRSTRQFARIQKDSVTYDWGLIDNYTTAPGIYLSLNGECEAALTLCSTLQPAATMTWGSWNGNATWFKWNSDSGTSGMYGRDKLGAHYVKMHAYTDTAELKTETPAIVGTRLVRCDSATYFAAPRPETCIYLETIPRVEYSTDADSPNKEVAQHIQDAFDNPDATYPTSQDSKEIPGRYDGTYAPESLHRITPSLHASWLNANASHKDAACSQTGDYATTGLPYNLQTKTGQECDEYPFRSTLEGAANQNWDFSVRAVTDRQNSSAGGSLSAFYESDRILAYDASLPDPDISNDTFYVQIHDF
ncbi:NucA/NucB deoxyribonuclease domain-containing protein [Streptomyces sp. NPDC058200]|uniref:NucA/NucB deoxyribonuclease domain-containing protein n=1 Tax=Streptomyces sp. NPDC058200 TaxID=3346378 RepID=UPI0036E3788E